MSWEAVAWALQQPVGHSPAKFVLVAIAECARKGETTAWPSITTLTQATCQNRKTVIANLRRLLELGYLEDTGERKGDTGRVVVYQLTTPSNQPKTGTIKGPSGEPETVPEQEPLNSTETGTIEENVIVPNSTSNSPNFDAKQSQKLPVIVPISPTEPVRTGHKRTSKNQPTREALPDWLPEPVWSEWMKFRGKKFTARAQELSLKSLERLHADGNDPTAVIEQSIERGWTGLFPLKTQKQFGRPAPQPENFKEKTYVGTDESAIGWM
jgi:hypothetical protein